MFTERKSKNLQNVNLNKNLGKKKIESMLPTKISMFYELSETILVFALHYLHLYFFQFLHRYLSLHVQFCSYVFQAKLAPSSGRQVFLSTVNKPDV